MCCRPSRGPQGPGLVPPQQRNLVVEPLQGTLVVVVQLQELQCRPSQRTLREAVLHTRARRLFAKPPLVQGQFQGAAVVGRSRQCKVSVVQAGRSRQ